MTTYTYKVRDQAGQVLEGQMEAVNDTELRRKLDENNYFIIDFGEVKAGKQSFNFNISLARVTFTDMAVFSWQLFTMLNAGLSLTNTLALLERQTKNELLTAAIKEIRRRVEEGITFADALKEHPHIFSNLYVQMVNAGEVGGVLDEMLKRLALFYEWQAHIRSRIKMALIYPSVLLAGSAAVVVFLVLYILPRFTDMFEQMGSSIPAVTLFFLQCSEFAKHYWYVFLTLVVLCFFLFRAYAAKEKGREQIDRIKLRLPVFGDLIRKTTAARFTRTLATLVSAGIPLLTSLDVVTDTIDNTIVTKALRRVSEGVGEGRSIAQPLADSNIFPEMVVNMIKVGEETGALEEMLNKVADYYNREVEDAIETFTKLIEPVIIVLMTVIIGFITMAIFLPMADLMQGMHS